MLTTASTQVGVCNLAGEHADNQHGNLLHFGMPLGLRGICTRRRQVRVRERRPKCLNSFPSLLRVSRTGLCPADSAWKGVGGGGGFRKDAQTSTESLERVGVGWGRKGEGMWEWPCNDLLRQFRPSGKLCGIMQRISGGTGECDWYHVHDAQMCLYAGLPAPWEHRHAHARAGARD